jgi:hypothetical protein
MTNPLTELTNPVIKPVTPLTIPLRADLIDPIIEVNLAINPADKLAILLTSFLKIPAILLTIPLTKLLSFPRIANAPLTAPSMALAVFLIAPPIVAASVPSTPQLSALVLVKTST